MENKKKRVVALAFSDLHLNIYGKFNENNKRTLNHFKVLSVIKDKCKEYQCPALFCGDILHKPENIDQGLMEVIYQEFEKLRLRENQIELFAISGNHDISKVSIIGKKPFSWLKFLEQFGIECIDYKKKLIFPDITVHGIPYIDHNVGLSEYINKMKIDDDKNILLLHTDYPGAKDTDGRTVDSVENLNLNVLKKFDLVLCGHIHKPQRLSKKVYMIGAPLQQRRTDRDCNMGYWKIYSDLSMKFVPLEDFPRFIDVENPEEIKDDGNYYTVIPKKEEKPQQQVNKIHKNLSKIKLARQYMKAKGIKDKEKLRLLKEVLRKSDSND